MAAPPPTPHLPRLFSALERMGPSSKAFLPTLKLFLQSSEEHKLLEKLEGSAATHVANVVEKFIEVLTFSDLPDYRKRTLRLLRSLCRSWGVLPTSYTFQGEVKFLDEHPFAPASRFVEMFRGESGGEMVAVKVLRVYLSEDPNKVKKRLSREAVIWKHLRHPNVLPLYGVSFNLRGGRSCLISPWMVNGTVRDFVANNPLFNLFKLLVDACNGLQYLHARDIVHGDLKGDNVLVDGDCRARLADFGLANFDRSQWLVATPGSSSPGGTTAYMAPELFSREPEDAQSGPLMRKKTDIYALGMVIYEVLSGKIPFHKVPSHSIMFKVLSGERPQRPPSIPDPIWEMLQACWSADLVKRPTLEHIAAI